MPASAAFEHGVERSGQILECHIVIEPVDRLDRQLIGHEFVDERQCLVGGRRLVVVAGAYLVAVGAADAVAMMSIGNEDVVGGDQRSNGLDSRRIRHPLDHVLDAVDGHRTQRLTGLGEQVGQARGEREPPHGRQVGLRGSGEIEPVGRRLGGHPLVGEHPAGALVDDFEAAQHAGDVALGARRVGEPHAVDRERRGVVVLHHAGVDPLVERRRSGEIPVGALRLLRHVDVGDVESAACIPTRRGRQRTARRTAGR